MSKDQRGKAKVIGSLRPRRAHWRFEDLQIWNSACDLAVDFHRIAGRLDGRRLNRYAEQLRAAGLSLPTTLLRGQAAPTNRNSSNFSIMPVDRCSKTHPCCRCLKDWNCSKRLKLTNCSGIAIP